LYKDKVNVLNFKFQNTKNVFFCDDLTIASFFFNDESQHRYAAFGRECAFQFRVLSHAAINAKTLTRFALRA